MPPGLGVRVDRSRGERGWQACLPVERELNGFVCSSLFVLGISRMGIRRIAAHVESARVRRRVFRLHGGC